MNILSGIYKGQKIKTVQSLPYRPTQTRIRKSLFDILGDLTDMSVLDLFSGTGILGFEAASRGADTVTFVENNTTVVNMLQQNVKLFQKTNFNVFRQDVFKYLNSNEQFDIIIADPPYSVYTLPKLVKLCINNLNNNGRFVLEAKSKDNSIIGDREKKYGDTKLAIWSKS